MHNTPETPLQAPPQTETAPSDRATEETPQNPPAALENSERRDLWTLLENPKPSFAEKMEAAFPTVSAELKKLCMGPLVQGLLSCLFPIKEPVTSPLGLTRSCRGYDRFTKDYLQETWLDRQLYPCHQNHILWQASSQPQKTSKLA